MKSSDDSYMPKSVKVCVGNSTSNMKELKTLSIPRYSSLIFIDHHGYLRMNEYIISCIILPLENTMVDLCYLVRLAVSINIYRYTFVVVTVMGVTHV